MIDGIHLTPGSIQDLVVRLGEEGTPDSYHIDDDSVFNRDTEYERRQLDRKSQRAITQHDDVLKKPPTREQLQQQQQAKQLLQKNGLGPLPHPILSKVAQFDGAVDPDANPVPSENTDVINELIEQYQLTQQPEFNPKPNAGHGQSGDKGNELVTASVTATAHIAQCNFNIKG